MDRAMAERVVSRRAGARRLAKARAPVIVTAVVALLATAFTSAGDASGDTRPATALTVRDMLGHALTLPAPPRRIVSLVPSATEIFFALGAEDRLVGVTDYCNYPHAARRKPSVGGMVSPSLETIVTLRPDLVVVTDEGTREETFAQLRRLGIPVFLVRAHRLDDVMTVIARLAVLTGTEATARRIVSEMERRVAAVRTAVSARPRPRVLYVVWPDPLIVPGRDSLVTELVHLAGGESITGRDRDMYPRFSLETAIARNPDVIVVATHGAGTGPASREKFERFSSVTAVKAGRIHAADGDLLHRYGPRIVEGVEALARAIHPGAIP
jgi:iron complex transport system substrate-binding protein